MVHKYYAIKNEGSIKTAMIVSTVFSLIIGCGAYFVGSFSRLFIPQTANGMPDIVGGYDEVMPTLLMQALSGGTLTNIVLAVIMLCLLSASMSTLSAVVLSSSSAVAVDLLGEVKPDIKPKKQMQIMRILCAVFIGCSFIFATMNISFIVNLMSFSWGIVAGSFIGPFLWGLYSKKVTRAGAWAGLLSGPLVVGGAITYFSISSGFGVAKAMAPELGVLAMFVSIIVVPVVSYFTAAPEAKHIETIFSK